MAQTAELDAAADTIEATLNYIVSDGSPVFTIVATPGGTDARSGATPDPRRVVIHNGRPHAGETKLLHRLAVSEPASGQASPRSTRRFRTA